MGKKDNGQWATNVAFHRDPLHGIRKNTAIASKSKKTQPTESMKSQFRLRRSANSTMQKSRSKKSRSKKSPYKRQHIRRQPSDRTESMKTQRVTIDDIQQRIRRELVRQQKEEKT